MFLPHKEGEEQVGLVVEVRAGRSTSVPNSGRRVGDPGPPDRKCRTRR